MLKTNIKAPIEVHLYQIFFKNESHILTYTFLNLMIYKLYKNKTFLHFICEHAVNVTLDQPLLTSN